MTQNDKSIHVWTVNTTENFLPNFLSASEKKKLNTFFYLKDKQSYYQAHNALRVILSKYLLTLPEDIRFSYTSYGKPFIEGKNLHFNLSHSGTMAVVALTKAAEIGVDIENTNRIVEYSDLAKRFFCDREFIKMERAKSKFTGRAFYNCWTRKEAFIKAIGEGLSFPLNDFEVNLLPDEPVQFNHIKGNYDVSNDWTLASMDVNEYTIATAIKKRHVIIEYLDFNLLIGKPATDNHSWDTRNDNNLTAYSNH